MESELRNSATSAGIYNNIPTSITSTVSVVTIIDGLSITKTADKQVWADGILTYTIIIDNKTENSLWQIFSIYHIPTTSDYLQTDFYNDNEYQNFLDMIKNRSNHKFNTNVGSNDNILTLSTCYNDNDKMVVYAKFIKRTKK